jgi:hypothetical protein
MDDPTFAEARLLGRTPCELAMASRRLTHRACVLQMCVRGTQALLICLEMLVAAVCHRSVFSYRRFKSSSSKGMFEALGQVFVPTDIVGDVGELGTAINAEMPASVRIISDGTGKLVRGWAPRPDGKYCQSLSI